MNAFLGSALEQCPLVAILRGIRPEEAAEIGDALIDAGLTVLEVPLNSPRPLQSIEAMAGRVGKEIVIGGGTVLDATAVADVRNAGGRLIVAPNADASVVAAARKEGLACIPGVMTPSEAFAMLKAGADALKLFPADMVGPGFLRNLRAVLPLEACVMPVGGIVPGSLAQWHEAGASGAGIGTALYRPGMGAQEVGRRARLLVREWEAIRASR